MLFRQGRFGLCVLTLPLLEVARRFYAVGFLQDNLFLRLFLRLRMYFGPWAELILAYVVHEGIL